MSEVVQVLLLAVATFIFAIDQYSLTEVLYRPIISCTIIGAILGDVKMGMIVGGTYEVIAIGNMPVGGSQPPNVVLTGVVSCTLAITAKLDVDAALGISIVFALFGQYATTFIFTLMSGLMSKADRAAEEANPKGITAVLNLEMFILGSFFAVIAVAAYFGGQAMARVLQKIAVEYAWIMAGLSAAGGMFKFVGFAILMKIMMEKDMWGIFLAGFATASIFGAVTSVSHSTLIFTGFIGLAIAFYDYSNGLKHKKAMEKEDASDGI